jgi:hypothetical protein
MKAYDYREILIRNTVKRMRPRITRPWLNVCPLNDAAPAFNVCVRNDAYNLLAAYHCENWWRIPKEIRKNLSELVREALDVPDPIEAARNR